MQDGATMWKHPVTLSLAYRFVLNVASPSHEVATGEYTEHKKADIYWEGRLYTNVPIISGNAVRRYIKEALRDIALSKGLPVGNLCRRGVFTHWNTTSDMEKDVGSNNYIEGMKKCIMEDVSGFMLAEGSKSAGGGKSAIRFSRLHVSMVKPVYSDLDNVSVYHIQFARHDIRRGEAGREKSAQMPFRVEHVSGRFAGLVTVDAHLIGYDDIGYNNGKTGYFLSREETIERVKAVVQAIHDGVYHRFGSMKARSLSVIAPDMTVITVVKGAYTPPDPSLGGEVRDYIKIVEKDLRAYTELTGSEAVLIYVSNSCGEGVGEGSEKLEIKCVSTTAEAFKQASEVITKYLRSAIPE